MAEETKTSLNPNHPVYFSYAGNNTADDELEKPVEELRERLDKENIDYRDYKVNGKSTFTYRHPMMDSEEQIGRGDIVVVVFSIKYLNSWHCMYEWYNIVHNSNDYKKRIFPIYLDDIRDRLKDKIRTSKLDKILDKNYDELADKEVEYPDQLTDADKFVLNLGRDAFKRELHLISKYFHDRSVPKLEKFDYDELLNQIKSRIDELNSTSNYQHNDSSFTESEQTQVTSLPILSFDTRKDIVPRPIEAKEIMRLFEHNQIVNLIGVGGCGKTTITESFVNIYSDAFNQKTGLFINYYYYREISVTYSKIFNIGYHAIGDDVPTSISFNIDEMTYAVIIDKLEMYPKDGNKFNLLIIDINEHADYDIIENALDNLRDNQRLKNWKILVVSREKMKSALVHFDPLKLETDKVDFSVLEDIFNKYLKGDNRYSFSREQLEKLFLKLGHLPILIEHLAYYLREASEARSFDFIWNYLGDGFEDHKMWFRQYDKIREFLSLLMCLDSLDEISQKIVRLLVIWPTEYYSAKLIRQFMSDGDDSNPRFVTAVDDCLNTLVDKCVLDSMDKGNTRCFKIHDIIKDQFYKQIFEDGDVEERIRSYSFYTKNVKTLLSSGEKIDSDSDTSNCISNTPLEIFGIGSTKDFAVYEDWLFLRGLAQLKCFDKELSELSYKAYLLKEFYNKSGEEIYNKIYGEYKNISSHLIYYRWLKNREEYDHPLPPEQTVNGISFILVDFEGVKFKMIKVSPDYYIAETQVTQELWTKVMGNNPSYFNEKRLDTDTSQYPVERVSWYDCMDFIIKLNDDKRLRRFKFNLPTSDEWKYAAHSGRIQERFLFCGSDNIDEVAWYYDNSQGHTHPVITPGKKPNGLGIHGMSGNVWEWCLDFGYGYGILCGGSWHDDVRGCCVSYHGGYFRDDPMNDTGFRLSLSSPKK